jgi:hypothetical protein
MRVQNLGTHTCGSFSYTISCSVRQARAKEPLLSTLRTVPSRSMAGAGCGEAGGACCCCCGDAGCCCGVPSAGVVALPEPLSRCALPLRCIELAELSAHTFSLQGSHTDILADSNAGTLCSKQCFACAGPGHAPPWWED